MKRTVIFFLTLSASCDFSYAQEARRYNTGLKFLESTAYQSIPLAAPLFAGPLPSQVDLAPFPKVGDQGSQGSCVGWAVAYALKTYQEEAERRWGLNSNAHVFSPAFIYNQIKVPGDCGGGSYFTDALNVLTRDGAVPLSVFPYDPARCDRIPNAQILQMAAPYRIASWRRVNTLDETEVKTHIAGGYPVLIGMPVDEPFMNLSGASIYQGLSGPVLGGHAMVVTGYDDSRSAFRLINSWGESWGDSGLAWISFTAFRKTVQEGYVAQDIILRSPDGSAAIPAIEFETIILSESPVGAKSITKTTGDHHCVSNCEGEPTRTNYSVEVVAGDGYLLKNPALKCKSGPCYGWNQIHYARLEQGGKKVVGSWDVWGSPTTWELSADEFQVTETSRFVRRVDLGESFSVLAETGAPPPLVKGKLSTGETFSFLAGKPTLNRYIRLVETQVQGPETVYRYETAVPN